MHNRLMLFAIILGLYFGPISNLRAQNVVEELVGPNMNPLSGEGFVYSQDAFNATLSNGPQFSGSAGNTFQSELPINREDPNTYCRVLPTGQEQCVVDDELRSRYRYDGKAKRTHPIVGHNPRDIIGAIARSPVLADPLSVDRYGDYITILSTSVALTEPAFAAAQASSAAAVTTYASALLEADQNLRFQFANAGAEGRVLDRAYMSSFRDAQKSHAEVIDKALGSRSGMPAASGVVFDSPYATAPNARDMGVHLSNIEGHPSYDTATGALAAVDGDMNLTDLGEAAKHKVRISAILFNPMRVWNATSYTPQFNEPLPTESAESLTKRKEDFVKFCGDIEISNYDDIAKVAAELPTADRTYNQLTVRHIRASDTTGPSRYYEAAVKDKWDRLMALVERRCAFDNWETVEVGGLAYVPIANISPSQYLTLNEGPVNATGDFWRDKEQRDALAALSIRGFSVTSDLIEALYNETYRKAALINLKNEKLDCEPLRTLLPTSKSNFTKVVQSGVADGNCDGGKCFERWASPFYIQSFTLARNLGVGAFYSMFEAMLRDIDKLTVPGDIVHDYARSLIHQCAGTVDLDKAIGKIADGTRQYANEGIIAGAAEDSGRSAAGVGERFVQEESAL